MDWQSTQNEEYILLLQRRLREPTLIWVQQFVGIINNWLCKQRHDFEEVSINDFGCNVGHFYRGISDIKSPVDYCGYDISDTYLKIASEAFPEANFINLDISGGVRPRAADISVMSATLEHIQNHVAALKNMFDTSRNLVILRTFVGENYHCDYCLTDGASAKYLIKQFMIDELLEYPKQVGWNAKLAIDIATGGKSKFVCNGRSIQRTQKIIVWARNEQ